ncbi:MAG: hypothetical protein S4CHLAM6_05800 [Chlamydiae bacterium]|nr:hypothetical protein [Chlamydiota bacterium]
MTKLIFTFILFFSSASLVAWPNEPVYIPKKVAIISIGMPGVGKTTIFKELSKRVSNYVYLNKDLVNDALLGDQKYFSDYYNTYVRFQGYDVILNLAYANLETSSKLVVLDAQFAGKLNNEGIKKFLDDPSFEKRIIYFHCSSQENKERLLARGESRNLDQLKNFEQHFSQTTKLYEEELKELNYLSINTEDDLEKNLELILDYIGCKSN